MRARTKKRAQQERIYASERKLFLAKYPACQRCGRKACQVHHMNNRHGDWLLLQRYWLPVCMECHRWIEDNRAEAETLGFVVRIRQSCAEHMLTLDDAVTPCQAVSPPASLR